MTADMSYRVKFSLYMLAAVTLVSVLAFLLYPLVRIANLVVAFASAYLTIVLGRRVLGRKDLWGMHRYYYGFEIYSRAEPAPALCWGA
jgi:hypothetical protein